MKQIKIEMTANVSTGNFYFMESYALKSCPINKNGTADFENVVFVEEFVGLSLGWLMDNVKGFSLDRINYENAYSCTYEDEHGTQHEGYTKEQFGVWIICGVGDDTHQVDFNTIKFN